MSVTSSENAAAGPRDGEPTGAVRPALTLAVVCIGFAMVIIDTTIVNVALPAIRENLGSSLAALQWVVDGYVLVLASFLLSGGALVDGLGSARVFRSAVVLFTLASVACGLAPTSTVLVGARLVQGVAAAMLMPAAMALIAQAYPEAKAKAKALALFTTVAGSPQAFGPVLGGLLVTTVGWRSIFFLNLPIGLVTLALTARGGLPTNRPDPHRRADVPGQLLMIATLAGVTGALIEGHAQGWTRPLPVVAGLLGLVCALGFIVRQRRTEHPMIPPVVVRAPRLMPFVLIGTLLFTAYYGLVFVLSLFLQQAHGFTALETGAQFLPSALPIFLLPVLVGRLTPRWGAHRVTLCGLVVAALGAAGLLLVPLTDGTLPLSLALLVLGCGVGLTVGPQIALVVSAAPAEVSGISSGLLNAGRQTGSVLGVAVLGALAATADPIVGLHLAALGAVAALAGAVLLALRRPAESGATTTEDGAAATEKTGADRVRDAP